MKNSKRVEAIFIITLILLVGLSIAMMASISFPRARVLGKTNHYFLIRHMSWIGAGIVCFFGIQRINYKNYKKIRGHLYIGCLVVLILVLFLGSDKNGARRWFSVAGFNFQPSEIAKLILIITLAGTIDFFKKKRKTHASLFLTMFVFSAIYAGLILAEKSFSSTIQIVMISIALMFISGIKILPLLFLCAFYGIVGFFAIISSTYRRNRFFNHIKSRDEVYQLEQSLIAIGSGKMVGRFYGNGVQKYGYLPEIHTDYIFAGYAEEMGFLGSLALIGLYIVLLGVIVYTIVKIKDRYAKYLLVGIFTMLSLQIVGNFIVVMGIFPATGIPLPIMSYGGSSMVTTFIALGIVFNIIKELAIPKNVESDYEL